MSLCLVRTCGMDTEFIDGSQNLFKKSTLTEVRHTLSTDRKVCDVWGMQENESHATRQAVLDLRAQPEIGVFIPRNSAAALPIAWHVSVFKNLPGRGQHCTYRGYPGVTPARWFVWQPLLHRFTKRTVLKINTHAVSGYAGDKYPGTDAQRDRRAKAHWTYCVKMTKYFLAQNKYDLILLGGDFNISLTNHQEPWYPGVLLAPYYQFDHGGGIDRLLFAKGSQAIGFTKQYRRTGIESDHPLALRSYRFRTVAA